MTADGPTEPLPPPTPDRRSSGAGRMFIVVVLIAIVGAGAYALGSRSNDEPESRRAIADDEQTPAAVIDEPPPRATTRRPVPGYEQTCPGADTHVSYRVSGTARGRALITYSTPSGIAQTTRSLPFEWDGCFGAYDFASVSVQNPADSGSVSCRIVIDGNAVASNSSSGAYVIASCNE